ncbi:MAG TPA: DUF4421 family protein [Phnomibacter sp.]|nr:DUF4421 family protein [Phnomibacter sp.]
MLAQKDSSKPSHDADTSYVKSYNEKLDLSLNFGSKYMEYKTFYSDSFYLNLRPNEVYVLSPSISYRWLSLSYSFTPEFLEFNNDNATKGTTEHRRLSTNFQFGQFNGVALWSKTKGFYIANTADITPGWLPGDPYIQFPDMEVKQFQVSGTYRSNKNYSVKAINGGDEEQLKSTWTFLPGLNFNHFKFRIPSHQDQAGKTELTNNTDVNITLPIAGTWVLAKHMYLAGIAGPIVGIDFFKSLALDENSQPTYSKGTRVSSGFYYGFNFGYNGPKWYAGTNVYSNSYRHGAGGDNERLSKKFTQINIYAGIRIEAPKPLKQVLDWTEKLLPFLK